MRAFFRPSPAAVAAAIFAVADQQKLWPPFEAAVRDGFQMRMDDLQKTLGEMRSGGHPSAAGGPGGTPGPGKRD